MSTLVVAVEGPCKGHLCDNCKTCQSGRCCRRDNPDYRLPELGEWDGPIYGELGVLNDDGDKVECHCCGGWYVSVGIHAAKAHDLTEAEYKAIFGLPSTHSLLSESQRKIMARIHTWHLDKFRPPFKGLTGEQKSHLFRGRKPRLAVQLRARTPRQAGYRRRSAHLTHCSYGHELTPQAIEARRCPVCSDARTAARQEQRVVLERQRESQAVTALHAFQLQRQRQRKSRELYGDNARLNFPDEG